MGDKKRKTAFVTYAWEDDAFQEKILNFVAYLRKNGIDATCDCVSLDQETSANFSQIMHDGLNCDKVIVVLSKAYKEKADCENTGVNKEYHVIASKKDIEKNKFIFVTFQGTTPKDLEEIVPVMYSGVEILDLSKMDEIENRLLAKMWDKKTIELPEIADEVPEIRTKTYAGTDLAGEKKKYIFSFQVSADCKKITYDNETKKQLRRWICAPDREYSIEIDNLYLQVLQEWVAQKDLEIDKGQDLSEEDEKTYCSIFEIKESIPKKNKEVKMAIQIFLEKLAPELVAYSLTVTDYLNIIEKIFESFYLNVPMAKVPMAKRNVDGWYYGARNDFVFKAAVTDIEYGTEQWSRLRMGDGRIEDFSRKDILEGIVPAFCVYYARGKLQNEEYVIDNGRFWLFSLQFGWA